MYHSISEDNEPVAPYYVTNTRPDAFRAQMHFLAKHNFRAIDLETALREPNQHERTVVITFDDGFHDFYTNAFPILREFGFTATMFLPTALIGGTLLGGTRSASPTNQGTGRNGPRLSKPQHAETDGNGVTSALRAETDRNGVASALCAESHPRPSDGRGTKGEGNNSQLRHSFKGRDCMTWDEVRTLAAEGIHFGSHTASHPKLYDLDWPQIEEELTESKRCLEEELDREITTFAYPFAYPEADREFTGKFECLLQKTGYRCNVTTRIGRAQRDDDPFSLRRLPMNSFDDTTLLRAKLEGSYDWLARPQSIVKKVKRWL